MIAHFNFENFQDKILITNDSGCFYFLSREDFSLFAEDRLPKDSQIANDLKDRHFYYDEDREVFLRRMQEPISCNHMYLFSPTTLFILAITNRCNHKCVYCQANGGAPIKDMSIDTVDRIIEHIAASPAKQINIEFQGGEPLTNFTAIRETVKLAKEKLNEKKVMYSLVSNLSYITDEIADFIAENGLSISTSLDGPDYLHNKNRKYLGSGDSFQAMLKGLEILRKRNVDVGAIETTTKFSLPYANEIVHAYVDLGFSSIFLRPLTRLGLAGKSWKEIGYSPREFVEFYRAALKEIVLLNNQGVSISESHASIFLRKMFGMSALNYMELRSPCGAGIGQLAFTANGDVFTCDEGRMLAEAGDNAFRLGNVFQNGYNEWIENKVCKAVSSASFLEGLPTCCDCVYNPYCGVCPVINYAVEGDLIAKSPNNDRCLVYKGIIETIMQYFYNNDDNTISIFRKWIN